MGGVGALLPFQGATRFRATRPVALRGKWHSDRVKAFRRSYRGFPVRTYPSGPDPLRTPPPRPDSDPILTRFGPQKADFGSESGQNQVKIRSGGRGLEGFGSREVGPAGKAL